MKLNLYAVYDNKAQALVRFGFGNNDTSFVRDNLPNDIYNAQTRSGLPLTDLEYKKIGEVDTETLVVNASEIVNVDIKNSYQFKVETQVEKVDVSENQS